MSVNCPLASLGFRQGDQPAYVGARKPATRLLERDEQANGEQPVHNPDTPMQTIAAKFRESQRRYRVQPLGGRAEFCSPFTTFAY